MIEENVSPGYTNVAIKADGVVQNGDSAALLATKRIWFMGTTAIVEVVGEIDRSNAESLGAAITEGTADAERAVIDLSLVGYLDSAALSMLQASAMRGIPTDLIAPKGTRARRLLDIAGIDLALSVFESIADANV
jgi:anti-anti-sigma factor